MFPAHSGAIFPIFKDKPQVWVKWSVRFKGSSRMTFIPVQMNKEWKNKNDYPNLKNLLRRVIESK